MSQTQDEQPRKGCPFHRVAGSFRPQSSRVGIGPIRYVYWNCFYWILETLNRGLSRDPNRKVSWDKWPPVLGLLYLLAKIRFNRSNALTDPYDYATNDTKTFGPEPEAARHGYITDGTWVSDNDDPQMGAVNTRLGSNIPPRKVRPDPEQITPSARDVGKARWRRVDEHGREIVKPALILNNLAGGWIQFQFHNFGGNTKHDPVSQCPHLLARKPEENWPDGEAAIVDRTSKDWTRTTDNGRPTVISEREMAWIQGQLYGTDENELVALRTFSGGGMIVDENRRLPEDPNKPGIDRTGFNNNYSPLLSFLHWLFVCEHNAIAAHYAYFNPEWDDERLFQQARKANVAQIARIHTVMWTEDLLQHPTLQMGMHADWYGFLGQRAKMAMMRFFDRHPTIARLMTWFRHYELIWGMPGSKWEHHDGPFQVPKQFRMVYRLHEMILSEQEIIEPGTDRLLDRVSLVDFIHGNTRPLVERFGYETLAWSFVKKSAGALTLHNFPRALTQFRNQQDGTWTDLAERDVFRERTDGTGTYNDFRQSLGEPPVTSFLELTGGDVEIARELEVLYEGNVDAVDAGIGILVEPKPAGFALGFCQFYQFVLNAPRRVKSNRHLTEGFTYAGYGVGMDWVEHGGGMLGAMARHVPGLRPQMEGVTRAFAPWKDTETFPQRMLTQTHEDTARLFKTDLRTFVLGAIAAAIGVYTGAFGIELAALLLGAFAVGSFALVVTRMFAMRFMQQVWQKCYTDKRTFMFGTLARAEKWINRSCFFGRLGALAITGGGAALAFTLHSSHPVVALLCGIVAVSGFATRKLSNTFVVDAQVLKISLRNRLRQGQELTSVAGLPGDTAIARRYWFLKGDNEKPVATFSSCFQTLKQTGLPSWKAFVTAFISVLNFGPKTQRGMTAAQKRAAGIGMFSIFKIFIPNLVLAQSKLTSGIYAPVGNAARLTPGDIDMEAFERMFRTYAPGRDYLTAYDFARMHEGDAVANARAGKGNILTRAVHKASARRRTDQLLMLFADHICEEDRKLVPAVTKATLLRFYQGVADYDLIKEHRYGSDT